MVAANKGNPPNFNPRPPYGERRAGDYISSAKDPISIHAPRMGSDTGVCGGRDVSDQFQSTPPVWGATVFPALLVVRRGYFNPRPPYGERRTHRLPLPIRIAFQSTPPVWGATSARAVGSSDTS